MKSLITLWNGLPTYDLFLESSTKFLTVFGTTFPNNSKINLPASYPPIVISKNTLFVTSAY